MWSQTRKWRSTSRSLAVIFGWHLVKDSPSVLSLGRLCNALESSHSWPSEETHRLSRVRKWSNAITKTSFHIWGYQTEDSTSIEFLTVKGNFERDKEVEDTMLDLLKPFTEVLEEQVASPSTPTSWAWSCLRKTVDHQEKERHLRLSTKRRPQVVQALSERSQLESL